MSLWRQLEKGQIKRVLKRNRGAYYLLLLLSNLHSNCIGITFQNKYQKCLLFILKS